MRAGATKHVYIRQLHECSNKRNRSRVRAELQMSQVHGLGKHVGRARRVATELPPDIQKINKIKSPPHI
jgi:hypothetical protein